MRSTRRNAASTPVSPSAKHSTGTNARRRGFLLALGAGGAGAAALAARSLTGVAPQGENTAPDDSRGYRITDHIKRYYHTTKT
jgi:hypothetical protein